MQIMHSNLQGGLYITDISGVESKANAHFIYSSDELIHLVTFSLFVHTNIIWTLKLH